MEKTSKDVKITPYVYKEDIEDEDMVRGLDKNNQSA